MPMVGSFALSSSTPFWVATQLISSDTSWPSY